MTSPSSPLSLAHDYQLNSASSQAQQLNHGDDYDMTPSSPRNRSSGHMASRSERSLQTTPSRGSTARRHARGAEEQENPPPTKLDRYSRAMTEPNRPRTNSVDNGNEPAAADESMVSTLSSFSAVPSSAMLARLAHVTPSKVGGTPRRADASPTRGAALRPRASRLDLGSAGSPPPPPRPTPRIRPTPSRQQLGSAMDSETPRSVPGITAREVESLKSQLLSEISSLKASLSGKEAEVRSLKAAVGDAEKRAGEALEKQREERALREQMAAEKEGWERRSRETETALGRMREEMRTTQRDKEELERQLEESEKKKDAAEMMHQEAETKLGSLRGSSSSSNSNSNSSSSNSRPASGASGGGGGGAGAREVEAAVERVARELHALYKSKHETKVAALKKSYEGRWEKKVRGLEARVEELLAELEARPDAEAARARVAEAEAAERAAQAQAQAVRDGAAMSEMTAEAERLEAVGASLQRDNEELRRMLQQERVEKGELVQLAEELMGMQQQQQQQQQQVVAPEHAEPPVAAVKPAARFSGLRAPGVSGLRAPAATKIASASSSSGGLPRPGARGGGMTGSTERVGSTRQP